MPGKYSLADTPELRARITAAKDRLTPEQLPQTTSGAVYTALRAFVNHSNPQLRRKFNAKQGGDNFTVEPDDASAAVEVCLWLSLVELG